MRGAVAPAGVPPEMAKVQLRCLPKQLLRNRSQGKFPGGRAGGRKILQRSFTPAPDDPEFAFRKTFGLAH